MADCCIICYKSAPPISSLRINIKKETSSNAFLEGQDCQESLKRFFRLLQSYLGGKRLGRNGLNGRGRGRRASEHGILDQVINAGFVSCEDCWKLVSSFCELHNRIEKLEMLLNWKLQMLVELLERSGKEPHNLKAFGERVSQLNIEGLSGYEIWCFKKQLVNKCERKLLRSSPLVRLCKYEPPKQKLEQPTCKIPRSRDASPSQIKFADPTILLQNMKGEPVETISHEVMEEDSNIGSFVIPTAITKTAIDGGNSVLSEHVVVKTEPGPRLLQETDPLAEADDEAEAATICAVSVKSEPVAMETDNFNDEVEGENESFPVIASIHYSNQQDNPPHPGTSPAPDCGDKLTERSHNIFVKPVETITKRSVTSRLRNVHRCTNCAKTFSTPDKLEEHELSHGNDEGWEKWSSLSANSSCDEDANEDGVSDSGSEFSKDYEYCSDDDTKFQSARRPWLPSLIPIPLYREHRILNTEAGVPLNISSRNMSKMTLTIYKICDFENCKRPLYSKAHYDNHRKYHFYRNRHFPNLTGKQQERDNSDKATSHGEAQKRMKSAEDSKQLNSRTSAPNQNSKRSKLSAQRQRQLEAHQKKKKEDWRGSITTSTNYQCDRNGCTANFRTSFQLQVHRLTVHGLPLEPTKFPTLQPQHFGYLKSKHQKDLTELSIFKNFKIKADPKHGNDMTVSLSGKAINAPGTICSKATPKQQLPNSRIRITNKALNTRTKLISSKSGKNSEGN